MTQNCLENHETKRRDVSSAQRCKERPRPVNLCGSSMQQAAACSAAGAPCYRLKAARTSHGKSKVSDSCKQRQALAAMALPYADSAEPRARLAIEGAFTLVVQFLCIRHGPVNGRVPHWWVVKVYRRQKFFVASWSLTTTWSKTRPYRRTTHGLDKQWHGASTRFRRAAKHKLDKIQGFSHVPTVAPSEVRLFRQCGVRSMSLSGGDACGRGL